MPLFRRDKNQAGAIPGPPPTPAKPAAPAVKKTPPGTGQYPTAHFVPGGGDQVLVGLLEAAKAQDWLGIRSTLSGFNGPDLSSLVGNMCQQSPEMDEWFPKAVGDGAGDPLATLVLGARTIERGWAVRTAKRATHVSQEQFKAFHEILREAEEILYEAADLDRESAAPWYFLMISGRGLEVGLPAVERRFEAGVSRHPGFLGIHRQMLQSLCKKWSGSHEQMHAFAMEAMRGPHGDQLAELAPLAHIEHWLDTGRKEPGLAYMRTENVQAELAEAYERSIGRPGFTTTARAPYLVYNTFAMALGLAALRPQAFAAFEATDGVVTQSPWSYLNSDQIFGYNFWRDWSRKSG
jgi:hypothetical protein